MVCRRKEDVKLKTAVSVGGVCYHLWRTLYDSHMCTRARTDVYLLYVQFLFPWEEILYIMDIVHESKNKLSGKNEAKGWCSQEEIPGIEGPVCAADFDDPLSEISLTITHVRSLSAGNVISDPTKLGSSFMRAPAAREYTPSGCCCSAVEDPVRSLEDRSRNVTRPREPRDGNGITEKYSVGFAWKPRHGVPHAGTRLPINKLRHFARDSRVLSSHSAATKDGLLPIQSIASMPLICVHSNTGGELFHRQNENDRTLWKLCENVRTLFVARTWVSSASKLMAQREESCIGILHIVAVDIYSFKEEEYNNRRTRYSLDILLNAATTDIYCSIVWFSSIDNWRD